MVMSRYERGRAKEYRAMIILRDQGWYVARSAASHGPVDIFAAKKGRILLVQVKSGGARVRRGELEQLIEWGRNFDGDAEVWHFKGRGVIQKRKIHRGSREGPP
jgi:Holliday junction resolvase